MATVGWLLFGSIPGVVVGSQLTVSVPERPLRAVLALVLGLSGLKLLDIPGSGLAIVIVVAAGVCALLVWIGRQTWVARQRARAEPVGPLAELEG
jgi:uncharacterized membrane protein YfcA